MKKFTELSLKNYLDELSSDAPVPGGGSVAAYAASLAMGLTQMVGKISLKRKKKAGLTPEEDKKDDQRRQNIQQLVDKLEASKTSAFTVVDTDALAFEKVMKDSTDANLYEAFEMQASLVGMICEASGLNEQMKGLVSGSIKNDLLVADSLLAAAFHGAYHTAHINVVYIKDTDKKAQAEKILEGLNARFNKGAGHAG